MKFLVKVSQTLFFVFMVAHTSSFAQKIKGNGTIVSQDRAVTDFIELDLDGIFDVKLIQGDAIGVKVETDENLQSFIMVENSGDKLKIYDENEENIKKYSKMTVYVTLRDVERLTLDMVGKVSTKDTLKLNILKLKSIESTGRIELLLDVPKLTVELDGFSDLKLAGSTDALDIKHKGSGNIDAFGLKAGDVIVNYSGVGNIDVTTDKSISITSSGVGHVNYKGAGIVAKSEATGAGTVKKVK